VRAKKEPYAGNARRRCPLRSDSTTKAQSIVRRIRDSTRDGKYYE
jgi:hypothetical protein